MILELSPPEIQLLFFLCDIVNDPLVVLKCVKPRMSTRTSRMQPKSILLRIFSFVLGMAAESSNCALTDGEKSKKIKSNPQITLIHSAQLKEESFQRGLLPE